MSDGMTDKRWAVLAYLVSRWDDIWSTPWATPAAIGLAHTDAEQ